MIACVLLSLGGLLFGGAQGESGAASDYGKPGEFPLKQTLTLTLGTGNLGHDPDDNPVVQMVEEETNVHIDWVPIESEEKRAIIFASDDYPDMCGSTGRWQTDMAGWLAEGIVVDLVPHLKQGYTPNLDRIFAKYPDSLAYMLNPAGQLMGLPHFRMLRETFLEQNYVINVKWLEKLGLEKPTTTEELKQVLIAFRDAGDLNGNGKVDEIPLMYSGRTSQTREQCFYGIFGGPIKEPFVIKNGKVTFAGMHSAFKNFVKYFADLYAEGLIDPESATQSYSDMMAKVDNPEGTLVGWLPVHAGSFYVVDQYPNRADYEPMSPPQVPGGPKPEMWVNPGYKAVKNMWFMTDKNPAPEITMAWSDLWYTLERTVQRLYGPLGTGVELVNGMYRILPHPNDPDFINKNAWPKPEGQGAILADDFGTRFELDPNRQTQYDYFHEYYADNIAKEQWDRPELTADENDEASMLATDIFKVWKETEARWITGRGDIDAEWDGYVAQLKAVGIERYIEIHQAAEDRYLAAQK